MEPTATGTFASTPLAHLVVYCAEHALDGSLVLRPEGDDASESADVVVFTGGMPSKIRIADAVEHLGRILVELGIIDDATYNASLMQLMSAGMLHGQLLMSQGKLDQAGLERGLRAQLARKLGHLFSRPPSTRYAFYQDVDLLQRVGGPEKLPVDPSGALLAGLRTNPSAAHVEKALTRIGQAGLRLRSPETLAKLQLSRGEKQIVDRLAAGVATFPELLALGALDARALRVFVYALLLLKHVEPIARPEVGPVSVAMKAVAAPTSDARVSVVMPSSSPSGKSEATERISVTTPSAPPHSSSRMPSAPPSERIAEIQARAAKIDDEDFFKMLGIDRNSTVDDARAAYFQLAKKWHPDRLPAELQGVHDEVARVFARFSEAHVTLTDPEKRERYLKLYDQGGGTPRAQAEVQSILEASTAYQKGAWFLSKGNFADAEPFAVKAFELAPNEPDHVALWSWVMANKPERRASGKYDDLLLKLDLALADSPKCESARYYRGCIRKLAGRPDAAILDFKTVAENNPKHLDAVREVRLYEMRKQQAATEQKEEGGGLFGRFMKKR